MRALGFEPKKEEVRNGVAYWTADFCGPCLTEAPQLLLPPQRLTTASRCHDTRRSRR